MFRCLLRGAADVPQRLNHSLLSIVSRAQASHLASARWVSTLLYYQSEHCCHETLFSSAFKQTEMVDLTKSITFSNSRHSTAPVPAAFILLAAFFGLFGRDSDDDDDATTVPPSVKRHLLKAHRHRRSGTYDRAERACHQALEVLARSKHSTSQAYIEGRAYVLDTLANIYLEQGKLDKAEANFKETMRTMLGAGMDQESEPMIEISLKLSKIYSNQKKYHVAEVGFLWCCEKAREKWQEGRTPESHAFLGMCLHGLGQYYLIVEEYGAASEAFSEAVEIAKDVYSQQDVQVAVMLNDLGTALDSQGRYKEAEEVVRQGLEMLCINKRILEIEEYLAIIQCNLAEILSHQGNEEAAVETCSKAETAARRTGDKLLCKAIRKRCSAIADI